MRNLKKILALALALVMTLSVMTVANAAFTDSKDINATYAEAVDVLSGMGVFKGTGTGATFSPKQSITRAEVAAIIYRIVTGDVTDKQAGIYADYAKFNDVKSTAWYAGYVGYCSNANLIKGDGKGNFLPTATVTGYQALAMILRAMGYDVNGEFTGSGWEVKVASTAQQRGILVNVSAGTLGTAAAREVVAELLFQAIQKSTVVYTPALGYYTADLLAGASTTSLGYKTFGLTSVTGIVVGNQATGETYTQVAFDVNGPSYAYANATAFNTTTGLDMFGHAMKVWYNAKNVGAKTVYASYDKATKAATVVAADANLASTAPAGLKNTVVAAGFSVLSNNAYWSGAYDQLSTLRAAASQYGASNTTMYYVVSNNTALTTDVVVKIDAQVAMISQINTTLVKNQTLTLANSTYGVNGVIAINSLTAGSVNTLGSVVIAKKVTGTNKVNTALPYYDLSATGTKAGTVIARDNVTGKIVLSDGTAIELSPLAQYNAVVKSGVTMPSTWNNASYTFVLDNDGKYLGARVNNDQSFIYGTFADYASAGLSTGTVNYYLTGVTLDGQIVTKDVTAYLGGNATNYDNLTVTKKAWSQNVLTPGTHTGYAIDSTGKLTTDTANAGVNKMYTNWQITKADVALGFKAYSDNATFMTNATKFIVVSGTGTDTLKVTTYNGISELLGSADSVTLLADAGKGNIYYTYSNYIYNNVIGATKQVDTVILGANDLTYTSTSNVYYCNTVVTGLTSTTTVGGQILPAVQYRFYKDGVAEMVYITGNAPAADTFYTLTAAGKTVNGDPVYTVTATTVGTISGNYTYIGATNNLDTAVIGATLKTVTGATVVNLANPNLALGSIAELNNAVSVGYTVTVDCVTNAAGAVTIIYVTAVA